MIQAGNGFSFPFESLLPCKIPRHFLRQNLYGDSSFEPCIFRSIHLSHSASAQRRENLVRSKFCARNERHDCGRLYPWRSLGKQLSSSHGRITGYTEVGDQSDLSFRVADNPSGIASTATLQSFRSETR